MVALSVDTPVLTTERLILRAPKAQDWDAWLGFHCSDRASFVGGGPKMTARESWRAFGHVIGHWVMRGYGMFVFTAKDDDIALGMTGPWFPEGWAEREIGWTIWSQAAEGKGYAAEAARAAINHAFSDLGWDTAVSYIDPDNARSIALAKRLGARLDPDAAQPDMGDDKRIEVYRHPKEVA